jgi:hypothetical protein
MKFAKLLLLSIIACCTIDAAAAEYTRYSGTLAHGPDGAVLVADNGKRYDVPEIDRNFLNDHAEKRVTVYGTATLPVGSDANEVLVDVDEIVVWAPRPPVTVEVDTETQSEKEAKAPVIVAPMFPIPF